jgi:hypothetical protein
MKLSLPILLLFVLAAAGAAWGQSNAIVDKVLSQKEIGRAEAAYLALIGGRVIVNGAPFSESASPEEALSIAISKGWLPRNGAQPLDIRNLSLLIMKAFKLRGGVMYTILPIRRYAYRELVARGVVNSSGGPNRVPAGDEALQIIGQASALKGGSK